MKILLATPVNNRKWILPYFLKHLYNIDFPKKDISLYFLINNSNDGSEKVLKNFKLNYQDEYDNIYIHKFKSKIKFEDNRTTRVRLKYSYHHLSDLRNKILDFASKNNFDYLLSCDSDILVPSDILKKLIKHNKHCCSSLIYNGYIVSPHKPHLFPNILKFDGKGYYHINNWYVKHSPYLMESKLIRVDATGAVVLMSKEIFNNKNIRYGFHYQGEDIYWSERVRSEGYNIYCDLGCFSKHIMTREMLNNYLKGEIYFENGSLC